MAIINSAAANTFVLPSTGFHGQSDNLTSIALVDATGDFPPQCAVRWSFRYGAGIPTNGATLYRRAVIKPETLQIIFNSAQMSPDWITLGNVKVRALGGNTVINQTTGLQVNKSFVVSFGFPVVSVEIIGSGNAKQTIGVVAMHFPYIVDELGTAQPTTNSPTAAVRGDIIDYLIVTVSAPMTIRELVVVPLLAEVTTGTWQKITDAPLLATAQDFAASRVLRLPLRATTQGQLTGAMQSLFDPSVTYPNGAVIPMGDRQLNTGPPPDDTKPNIQIPTLAFLRLAAILPKTAQLLGLLIEVNAQQADVANAWDYLIVGHWGPRNPQLTGGQRANLNGTPGGPVAVVNGLLLESMSNLAFGPNGLKLGPSAIWIHFAAPGMGPLASGRAMVVELEMVANKYSRVEVTAFNEFRVVDWAYAAGTLRITVCADLIDTLCVYGDADAEISAVTWSTTDPALVGAPTANIGDVYYWMFSARDHPVPAAPQGLVVGQLEGLWNDPDWSTPPNPLNSPPTYEASDPKRLTVGVRWTATPPVTDVMMFYAAAYQVLRGPNQQSAVVIAGNKHPLVVPPPLPPNNVFTGSLPPDSGPWYHIDEVEAKTPTQMVYGVSGVDLFGRKSNPAYTSPITFSRTSASDPTANLQATLQDDGTILVTWAWNGKDPYLSGFKVYFKAGSISSTLYTGQVVSVGPAALTTFPLSVSIDTTNLDINGLANTVIRVGGDHYVVQSATATTVQVTPTGGGAATNTPGLSLTMNLNPSTPSETPSLGDVVVISVTQVQPGQPVLGSSYDGSLAVNTSPYGATTTTEGTSNSGQPVLQVVDTDGFIVNQYVTLNLGQPNQEAAIIGSIQSGPPTTLTLVTSLQKSHAPGETVTQFQAVLTPVVPPAPGNVSWSPADPNGISTISVGVSSVNDSNIESMICGPMVVKQIPTAEGLAVPPAPLATVEQIVFTGPPDAYGLCSYLYAPNFTSTTPSSPVLYHVYRALDTTLLAVDAEFRGPTREGPRTLAGVSYDKTVYNPDGSPVNPAPLQVVDFQAVTVGLPDRSQLSVTNWNAIANLFGNEAAFQRITNTPVSSSGTTLTYLDTGLPAGSSSKYFYRLRAVTTSSDQGQFGWASSPVQLWPQPPTRPTIKSLRVSGNLLFVQWNANPEPEVTGYRVYFANDVLDAQDIRSMTLKVELTGTEVDGESQVPTSTVVEITQRAPEQGQRYWVAVVAVADYTALTKNSPNPGKVASASSDPVSVIPQTFAAPTPPEPTSVTVNAVGGQVQLTFACAPNQTTKYMLLRSLSGSNSSPIAISTWQSPNAGSASITLTDVLPIGTNSEYVIGCTNESSRVTYSDPIPYPAAGGNS